MRARLTKQQYVAAKSKKGDNPNETLGSFCATDPTINKLTEALFRLTRVFLG